MAKQQNIKNCTVDGCEKPLLARGYCTMHLQRVRKYGDPARGRLPAKTCIVDGCESKNDTRGMCGKHYQRFVRYGNVHHVTSEQDRRILSRRSQPKLGQLKPHVYPKYLGRHLHRQIAEQKIGRPLQRGEIVHHIDGDPHNNKPENLEVLMSQSVHARRHKFGGRHKFSI